MEQFITQKGTTLFYEVGYDLGGYNHFTSEQEPRAYNLYIKRNKNITSAFQGLDNPSGAIRFVLNEVGRKSKKQETIAKGMVTKEFLQNIADKYNI